MWFLNIFYPFINERDLNVGLYQHTNNEVRYVLCRSRDIQKIKPNWQSHEQGAQTDVTKHYQPAHAVHKLSKRIQDWATNWR